MAPAGNNLALTVSARGLIARRDFPGDWLSHLDPILDCGLKYKVKAVLPQDSVAVEGRN
jgi:hypothetical protein